MSTHRKRGRGSTARRAAGVAAAKQAPEPAPPPATRRSRPRLTLSERMARIRKTDTKPELIVRRIAHGFGYRFRLHRRDLPGTPDLAFPRLRKVILVHGCFWHRHDCRDGRKLPSGKPGYWEPKLQRNAERDRQTLAQLAALGWDHLVIWECELRNARGIAARIGAFLSKKPGDPRPSSTFPAQVTVL